MTENRKDIIGLLLIGWYLKPWKNHNGTDCFRLYDPQGVPRRNVLQSTIKNLDRFIDPKIQIWKKDKRTRTMKLNLSMVRQLHGRNMIKKLYKQHKKQLA